MIDNGTKEKIQMGKKVEIPEELGVPSIEIIEPQEVKRSLGYFAEDGNYGDAVGLLVLETTYWREIDWEILEAASDSQRVNVAKLITESYEKPEDLAALYTKFEQYGIDLDDFMPREELQLDNDQAIG
jgi:hypothetical protein